jgi:hypothetical protein
VSVRVKTATLLGVCVVFVSAGCGTFESTAITDITLRNDTTHAAVVKACLTSGCSRFRYVKRVAAGRSVAATDYGDGRSWWLVLNPHGERVGCLSLNYTQRVEGYVIRLSTITACPTN